MTRKTQGVYDLVAEVLQNQQQPYGEDIIEDVCLDIEHNPLWHQRYRELEAELGTMVINNWIGQYVKQISGMNTIREVTAKRSSLINDYTKLSH